MTLDKEQLAGEGEMEEKGVFGRGLHVQGLDSALGVTVRRFLS